MIPRSTGALAARRGLKLDLAALSRELRIPVVNTVGVKRNGIDALLQQLDSFAFDAQTDAPSETVTTPEQLQRDQAEVTRLLGLIGAERVADDTASEPHVASCFIDCRPHQFMQPVSRFFKRFRVGPPLMAASKPHCDGLALGSI